MVVLSPDDLRSISHRDERYQRALAILNNDWSQVLLAFPHGNPYIAWADISFAQKLSHQLAHQNTFQLDSFSQVQAFVSKFQSYLPQTVVEKLKEPYL